MVNLQSPPIYYSIHSDPTFGDFIKKNRDEKNGVFDPAKLRAFNPDVSFPVGSLTLKAAWKVGAQPRHRGVALGCVWRRER
jgi:hypothetical protein